MQPEPQHQSPSPEKYPQPEMLPKPKPKPWLIGAVAAIALGAGAFFFGMGPFAPQQSDDMSQQQVQRALTPFDGQFGNYFYVNLNDPKEKAKAMASLNLPAAEAQQIVQSAEQRQCKLAWASCYDTAGSRGNVYEISSLGYTLKVPLHREPTTFVIPVMEGGSIEVKAIDSNGILRETRQIPEQDLYNRTSHIVPAHGM